MTAILAVNWISLLLALLIGLGTGWWLWRVPTNDWGESEFDGLAGYDDDDNFPSPPDDAPPPQAMADRNAAAGTPGGFVAASAAAGMALRDEIAMPFAARTPDDLTLLKGVGPKLGTLLNGLGITRFEQIAQWTPQDIAEIDPYLDNFSGRIQRDRWVEQATLLAAGNLEEFAARFGGKDDRKGGHAAPGDTPTA